MIEQPFAYKNVLAILRQIDPLVKSPEDLVSSKKASSVDHKKKQRQKLKPQKESSDNSKSEKLTSEVVSSVENEASGNYKLYHLIKEVIAENKAIEISHPEFSSIKICSEKHWFIFPEDLDKQTRLFRTSVNDFTIEEKGDEIRKQVFSGVFPKALWELVYTATLLGTEGELLEPLLAEDQLHLIELPEFEKAPHNEKHIAIADYMISHSATAGEVADALEIELSIVIDFCNACQAIHLIETNTEELDSLPEDEGDTTIESKIVRTEPKASKLIHSLFSNIGKKHG